MKNDRRTPAKERRDAAWALYPGRERSGFTAHWLKDPCIAAHVQREIRKTDANKTFVLRPLGLSWASAFAPRRIVRAFVLATQLHLCRALWLTTCGRCLQRNAQADMLLSLIYCFACGSPQKSASFPEPELVFCPNDSPLRAGVLSPNLDPTSTAWRSGRVSVSPGGFGIVRSHPQSWNLVFVATPASRSFFKQIAVLPDPAGAKRVYVDPVQYMAGGLVVALDGVIVVRNPFPDDRLSVELHPGEDPQRIGESHVADCREYTHIFS